MFNKSIFGEKMDIKVKLKRLAAQEISKFMSVSLMHFADRHKIVLLKFRALIFRNRLEKRYFLSPVSVTPLPEIFHVLYSYYTGLHMVYYRM
jgi:hypothetical protein